jgi:cation-transporting ATPase G
MWVRVRRAPGDGGDGTEPREPERLWEVTQLRAAAVSGALLLGAVAAARAGWRVGATVAQAAALLVGAWTFVPSTLRRLAKGRIGVGTLMSMAAAGAVLLGDLGEAAMLAFLFSISEGLEEYSVARTRRGLRALLSLVPAQATLLRDGKPGGPGWVSASITTA